MIDKLKLEGGKELQRALEAVVVKTRKKYLRTSLRAAAKPVRDEVARRAPRRTSLPPRTTGKPLHRTIKVRTAGKQQGFTAAVQVGAAPHGLLLEFGTVNMSATPFMRPAFDATKAMAIREFKTKLGTLIEKGAKP